MKESLLKGVVSMEYQTLETLLKALCEGNDLHICIHDISGILEQPELELPFYYQIHARPFCDVAKETRLGLELCLRCKERANQKAVRTGEYFDGRCAYGLYELVYPVKIDGNIKCIIYIGYIEKNYRETEESMMKTARFTGTDAGRLRSCLAQAQKYVSREHYLSLARLTEERIRMLYQSAELRGGGNRHWVVKKICRDIEMHFSGELSLKREAQLYFLNEKYVGRLFRRETGLTFHEYLNRVRLTHALQQLQKTQKTVLEISLESGFQNVTYFNRIFKETFEMTPIQYRQRKT
ncbi:helix-turn-helix domain-containing protein [Ructibacterium gallinarum]|nr:helix-turn-helix domain-containing protein [Ructibacterium gallinarum]